MMPAHRLLLVCTALLTGGCASIPPALQPPSGERLLATWQASGRWVYHCRLSNDGRQQAWATLRPEGEVKDTNGQVVGRLESGPNLVHRDGSVAELTSSALHESPGALPWVLYAARPAGASGSLAGVTSVLQLRSSGGARPEEGCTSGDQLMAERAIPFTAELRLFGR